MYGTVRMRRRSVQLVVQRKRYPEVCPNRSPLLRELCSRVPGIRMWCILHNVYARLYDGEKSRLAMTVMSDERRRYFIREGGTQRTIWL